MAYKSFANTVFMKEGIEDEGCRLLLMGKTGSGKSTTGNLIFNETVFASKMGPSSVTRDCQTHTDVVNNKRVTVIDTPDFRFSTHTDTDSDLKLKRALELCSPGAHVILLILPLGIFTEQEMDFIGWFEQKFGVKALRHTLVIFTHADQRHMRSLEEMIRENTKLSDFINRGALRYHEFNIKAPANRQQVTELMEKIDKLLTENSNSYYALEMMQETERRREEEVREREHQMTLDRGGDETEEERRAEKEKKDTEHHIDLDKEVGEVTETCQVKELEEKGEGADLNDHTITETDNGFKVCKFVLEKKCIILTVTSVAFAIIVLLLSVILTQP